MTTKIDNKTQLEKIIKQGLDSGDNDKNAKKGKLGKKEYERYVRKTIENDLLEQLDNAGRDTAFNRNMIDDYMFYYDLKEKMKRDINRRGLMVTITSGNGFERPETNENVAEMQKVTRLMLKILHDLDLQDPLEKEELNFNDFM